MINSPKHCWLRTRPPHQRNHILLFASPLFRTMSLAIAVSHLITLSAIDDQPKSDRTEAHQAARTPVVGHPWCEQHRKRNRSANDEPARSCRASATAPRINQHAAFRVRFGEDRLERATAIKGAAVIRHFHQVKRLRAAVDFGFL